MACAVCARAHIERNCTKTNGQKHSSSNAGMLRMPLEERWTFRQLNFLNATRVHAHTCTSRLPGRMSQMHRKQTSLRSRALTSGDVPLPKHVQNWIDYKIKMWKIASDPLTIARRLFLSFWFIDFSDLLSISRDIYFSSHSFPLEFFHN